MMGATIDHTIHLTELSEEICRSLFYHIAFFDGERKESKMFEEVGNEIVKKCKGLPLAAKTLGSLIRSKKTIQQWQDVLNNKIWELQEVEQQVFQPLLLSYYDLEPPTKRCLLYCATFPKDYVFHKDELIELWMSQDYLNVRGNKGNKTIGQMYFENLVMRSFFQDFVEDDDGNIIRCKMHDIVHDFVLYLTKEECFSVIVKGGNERRELPGDEVRHLTLLFAPEGPFPVYFLNSKSLRTLTSFVSKLTSIGVEAFSQLKCLRTLNLSGNYINEVPKEIGGLIHLRYLDLSNNYKLKELPDSLCDLYNLQTLRLTGCRQLVKLPKEEAMRKLTNLKHLYVEGSCDLKSKGISRLRNLKTLDVFHVHRGDDSEGLRLEDLEKLHQLEGTVSIRNLRYVKDASEAAKAMLNVKHNLLHLELDLACRGCEYDNYEERKHDGEIVNALQPHPELESLRIQEYYAKTLCPEWLMSLHKLTRLALVECIHCEVFPPLGKLPSLESLEITWMEKVKKVGVEFLASAILFPKLKKLVFDDMRAWEEWGGVAGWTDDSQIKIMPSLNYLQFEKVPDLKTLPDFLRKTPLQHLVIKYNCPYLKRIVEQRSGKEWAKISHIPNIQIR